MNIGEVLANNVGNIVVAAVVILIVALVIVSMVRDKKAGKSLQCGCDCKNCSGHCNHMS